MTQQRGFWQEGIPAWSSYFLGLRSRLILVRLPGRVLGVDAAQGPPHSAVALEAAPEGDLPDAVSVTHAPQRLNVGQHIPAAAQQVMTSQKWQDAREPTLTPSRCGSPGLPLRCWYLERLVVTRQGGWLPVQTDTDVLKPSACSANAEETHLQAQVICGSQNIAPDASPSFQAAVVATIHPAQHHQHIVTGTASSQAWLLYESDSKCLLSAQIS